MNPCTACESGSYYYFYDALGNVNGVLEEKNGFYHYYRWEMDAFGNDLPGDNEFLAMDQSGPKEHLTGKMFDTVSGLYYFHARWYDGEVGRFLSKDLLGTRRDYFYCKNQPTNMFDPDGQEEYWIVDNILHNFGPAFKTCRKFVFENDRSCCKLNKLHEASQRLKNRLRILEEENRRDPIYEDPATRLGRRYGGLGVDLGTRKQAGLYRDTGDDCLNECVCAEEKAEADFLNGKFGSADRFKDFMNHCNRKAKDVQSCENAILIPTDIAGTRAHLNCIINNINYLEGYIGYIELR